jgi:hypothetical protein
MHVQVDIISSATGQTYSFPFNNWIDEKNGLDHIIYRDGVQGAVVPLQEYRIVVYTSDVRLVMAQELRTALVLYENRGFEAHNE